MAAAPLLALLLAPLALAQQVTIIGMVVDSRGSPLAGAVVEAYSKDGFLIGSTATLSNGYFSLPLPRGEAYLVIYKRGYERREIAIVLAKEGTNNIGVVALDYAMRVSMGATYVVVDQGSTVEIPLTVTNVGSYAENVELEVDAPPAWKVTVAMQDLLIKSFFINPGETKAFKVKIRAPGSGEGRATITIKLLYANVTQPIAITAEARYKDWEFVTPYYTTVASFAGSRLSIPLRIRNPLPQSCTLNVSLATPAGWAAAVLFNNVNAASFRLDPGETLSAQLIVYVPETAEPGKYVVSIQATVTDIRSFSYVIVEVEEKYDRLLMETPTPLVMARPGDTVTIPLTISNDGTRAAVARFSAEGLPAGYGWSVRDEQGNVIPSVLIPPKSRQRILLVVSIPATASPTAVSFRFSAAGLNSTATVELGINVVGIPSLRILNRNWEVELSAGSSTVFELSVMNDGQVPLREVSVSLDSGAQSGLQVSVDPPRVAGLQPGGVASFTLTITADSRLEPGRYLLPVVVVADGLRQERMLAVNVRTGGGYLYTLTSLLVLALVVAAYLVTVKRPQSAAPAPRGHGAAEQVSRSE